MLMRHTNDLTVTLINPEDAANLLVFETQEREWFEQYIEARSEGFYTLEGITQHIIECLVLNAQCRMNPLLIRVKASSLAVPIYAIYTTAMARSVIASQSKPAGKGLPSVHCNT